MENVTPARKDVHSPMQTGTLTKTLAILNLALKPDSTTPALHQNSRRSYTNTAQPVLAKNTTKNTLLNAEMVLILAQIPALTLVEQPIHQLPKDQQQTLQPLTLTQLPKKQ